MKISKIGYIFIYLGVITVLGYLCFAVIRFPSNENGIVCKNLSIYLIDNENIKLISQTEIASILELKDLNPIGKSFKRIKTESIEFELLKNPMIKNAVCYKMPSGTVYLEVMQRCPKYIIAGNECFYIDSDRKILPLSLNNALYVPVVSGRITKSFASGEMYDFISYLEKDSFWNAQIEQIFVRDDLKIELIPRVGDATIILGKLENYESKLKYLHKLYTQGFNTIGWNRYKTIDLQYTNQIICSKSGIFRVEPIKADSIVQKTDSTKPIEIHKVKELPKISANTNHNKKK